MGPTFISHAYANVLGFVTHSVVHIYSTLGSRCYSYGTGTVPVPYGVCYTLTTPCTGFPLPDLSMRLVSWNLVFLYMLRMSATAFSTAAQCTTNKAAFVFLHGLGDTPAGWSS